MNKKIIYKVRKMACTIIEKKLQILEHFAAAAGVYYSFNVTRNIIPGVVYQIIDGKEYNANEIIGFPENVSFTEYITYWGNKLNEEYKKPYFEFFDREHLLEQFQQGKEHLTHTYWTVTVTEEPMLAEQHIIMFEDEESGEVLAITYILNKTEKYREEVYKKELAKTAEEAQRANMAKTDFLRRMSHDIRTPINGIRGIISIANHHPDDIKKQKEYRDKIMEASGYLLDLVNNILDMNKLESGDIMLEYKPFDLMEVFRESNTIIQMQSEVNNIPLIVNNYEIQHTHLLGSPLHIKQILQNIVGNAIKYNRPGGSVTVSCTELFCENGKATYKMICTDTGYGMSDEFQKHAFEPFAQETKDARTTYMGTGLGLCIAKQFVELMGGTISLESKQNVGTTFTIILSFDIDSHYLEASEEKQNVTDISLEGIHALLVEDNDLNMEIAKFILEKNGIVVTTAWNGQEAVEVFKASRKNQFDVILMDVMMPVMDGLEATRMIRGLEREDAATIPVIAITANAFLDDMQQSKDAGMNAHLSKPLQEQEMLKNIRKLVSKSSFASKKI